MSKLFGLVILCMSVCSFAHAGTITAIVGDIDHLGGEIAPGATSFPGNFDNRSAAELAATDGAQFTDYSDTPYGPWQGNSEFKFNYGAVGGISSATLTVGFGGVQSMNDRLYLDETFMTNVFPEQGANGYDGAYSWNIDSSLFSLLADGAATFRFNFNSNTRGEPVVFDYVQLTINSVPEPTTMAMLGVGAAGLAFAKRRREQKA